MSKPGPTIDWGYPTPADGPAPVFNTIAEEAEFWDTHGLTESGDIELLCAEDLAGLDLTRYGDQRNETDSPSRGRNPHPSP
jgi:hypothetical protein